jgi:hypothetical protein
MLRWPAAAKPDAIGLGSDDAIGLGSDDAIGLGSDDAIGLGSDDAIGLGSDLGDVFPFAVHVMMHWYRS